LIERQTRKKISSFTANKKSSSNLPDLAEETHFVLKPKSNANVSYCPIHFTSLDLKKSTKRRTY
jgi:hypothetical protein